jgi:hypothetical protein
MTNWLQTKLLEGWVQSARLKAMAHLGPQKGNEIDGVVLITFEMYLWCTIFYATDNRLGTSPFNNREERSELILASIKRIMKRIQKGSPLTNDDLLEWSQIIGIFLGHFDRFVTSMGGTLALCKPMFSLCLRALINNDTLNRVFPSADHIKAFDLAAAHGAVHLLNLGGRLTTYHVIDQPVSSLDFDAPDVFVSYASEDRSTALVFADSLNHLKVAAWIDRNIQATSQFARTIDARIQTARVVLVLWSNTSVSSRWVQAEALHGFHMNRLVSVRIEPCQLPVPFNAVQVIDWPPSQSPSVENWTQLLSTLAPRLGRPGLSEYTAASLDPERLRAWKTMYAEDPLAAF